MQIQTASDQEAAVLEQRFQAIVHTLGPMVELVAVLPDGRVLSSPAGGTSPAARCASLNERIEDALDRQSRGSL